MSANGVEIGPQAKAAFASRFGEAGVWTPPVRLDGGDLKEKKVRSRSTFTGLMSVDQCSGMEEISFRSAIIAVGTEF
jgi:hypothetical protein